jgi:hypothetical protein
MNERTLQDHPTLPAIVVSYGAPQTALTALVAESFEKAKTSDIPTSAIFALEGMSGSRYRLFVNALIHDLSDARYLEIGIWKGSTLCSAIFENALQAVAIDNWSKWGGPREEFLANLERFQGKDANVKVIDSDFRQLNYAALGRFNVYFFDGPHGEQDQFDGLRLPLPALDDHFVFIVDDWNWPEVRSGTLKAINDLGLSQELGITVRTTFDDTHPNHDGRKAGLTEWHNGYFISVLKKLA